jgi:hypothetical protein
MLDPAAKADFERQYRLVLVMYTAMLASIFVYLGIGFVLVRILTSRPQGSSEPFVLVFYGLAATLSGVILRVRKSWLAPLFSSTAGDLSSSLSRYRTGYILVFVLCETITIFGLVLLFLMGSLIHLVYFALLSLAMMTISYPKRVE